MLNPTKAFSSFSVNDIQKAREFYGEDAGVENRQWAGGHVGGGSLRRDKSPNVSKAEPSARHLYGPEFPRGKRGRRGRRTQPARGALRNLQRAWFEDGCARDFPREWPDHRLVQGSGGKYIVSPGSGVAAVVRLPEPSLGIAGVTAAGKKVWILAMARALLPCCGSGREARQTRA